MPQDDSTYFHEESIITQLKKLGELSVIGDDAAVVSNLVISTDTITERVHFSKKDTPESIAALGIVASCSDIFAMGIKPRWYLLSINAPNLPKIWFTRFMQQLRRSQKKYGISLIGGNTSRSSVRSFTVTTLGKRDGKKIVKRGQAMSGETIYIQSSLGRAAYFRKFHNRLPQPQEWHWYHNKDLDAIAKTTSAIDISDGLLLDLPKLLQGRGAIIQTEKIPCYHKIKKDANVTDKQRMFLVLSGGEDYCICATSKQPLEKLGWFPIGTVQGKKIRYYFQEKKIALSGSTKGFSHF